MTGDKFTSVLEQSELLWDLDLKELQMLVNQYPYSQNLRFLLAKKSQLDNNPEFIKHLNLAATYAPDRTYLYHYIKNSIALPQEQGNNAKDNFAYDLTEALDGLEDISVEEEVMPTVPAFELIAEDTIELSDLETVEEKTLDEQIVGNISLIENDNELKSSSGTEDLTLEKSSIETSSLTINEDDKEVDQKETPKTTFELQIEDAEIKSEEKNDNIEAEIPLEVIDDTIINLEPAKETKTIEKILPNLEDLAEVEFEHSEGEQEIDVELEEKTMAEPKLISESTKKEDALPYENSDKEIDPYQPMEIQNNTPDTKHSTSKEGTGISFSQWLTQLKPTVKPTEDRIEKDNSSKKKRKKSKKKDDSDIIWTFEEKKETVSPPKKSKSSRKLKKKAVKKMAKDSVKQDKGLVAENLAKILVAQDKIDDAIEMYEKLILKFPEKSTYFAQKLKRLKNKQ